MGAQHRPWRGIAVLNYIQDVVRLRPPQGGGSSAQLVAGQALRHPARGGQRAEVGRIERRIPFGEVDDAHPRIGCELADRPEEIGAAIPPGRAPGAAGNCARSITSMSQSTTIASQCATCASARSIARSIPSRRTSPMVTTRLPAVDRVAVHGLGCWRRSPGRSARCSRPAARPRSSARTGLPLLRPWCVSRMSKWASSVISPTLLERQPKPEHARPRHRIVAADQQRQRMRARRSLRLRRGSGPSPPRCRARRIRTSPRSAIRVDKLAAGLDVVAADRFAASARSSPGAWSHPPGVTDPAASGAPTSPTGARRRVRRSGRKDWASRSSL